jgi:hypothetical protein
MLALFEYITARIELAHLYTVSKLFFWLLVLASILYIETSIFFALIFLKDIYTYSLPKNIQKIAVSRIIVP